MLQRASPALILFISAIVKWHWNLGWCTGTGLAHNPHVCPSPPTLPGGYHIAPQGAPKHQKTTLVWWRAQRLQFLATPVTLEQREPVAVTGRIGAAILTLREEMWSQINTVQYLPDLTAGCSAQKPRWLAGDPGRDAPALSGKHRVRAPSSTQVQSESCIFSLLLENLTNLIS